MQIPLADAIHQLRNQLRKAVVEGAGEDIVFTPNEIELELAVNFTAEATAGGGFKLFAFLDVSTEGKASRESEHKIKLSLSVADKNGKPIKVLSSVAPTDLPQ